MSEPTASGVYVIENRLTGRIYIGKAVNFARRWRGHRAQLQKGMHHNSRLQADWSRYGPEGFTFRVHTLAPSDQMSAIEEDLIARHLGDGCYNWTARGSLGRPEMPPSERQVQRTVRMNRAAWDKIDAAGLEWLRTLIKRAKSK